MPRTLLLASLILKQTIPYKVSELLAHADTEPASVLSSQLPPPLSAPAWLTNFFYFYIYDIGIFK